jgi:quinoprotein glucose dehydrogenase
MTPGNAGGIHWGGMCFDGKQGLLVTNINWFASYHTNAAKRKVG